MTQRRDAFSMAHPSKGNLWQVPYACYSAGGCSVHPRPLLLENDAEAYFGKAHERQEELGNDWLIISRCLLALVLFAVFPSRPQANSIAGKPKRGRVLDGWVGWGVGWRGKGGAARGGQGTPSALRMD